MHKLNEKTARFILENNLKGSKKKRSSLIDIAKAVRYLLNNCEYSSRSELAKDFEISRPIIEAFDRINNQPTEIQQLIKKNKIGLDTSLKLLSIRDDKKRIKVAKAVVDLSSFDARYVIDFVKKRPDLSVEKCKQIVLASKIEQKKLNVLVIPLEEKIFLDFKKISNRKRQSIEDSAISAIQNWIKENKK